MKHALKYAPLRDYLAGQTASEVPMTFGEIERVIGAELPPKAPSHRAWWSNNPSNNVMTKAWLDAGFRAERVELEKGRLVFRKVGANESRPLGGAGAASHIDHAGSVRRLARQGWETLFGSLRGTVLIRSDLTLPIGDPWQAEGGE